MIVRAKLLVSYATLGWAAARLALFFESFVMSSTKSLAPFRSCLFLIAFFWLMAPAVVLAECPAVSGPNGKISIEGGRYDDENAALALGSYTIPLGQSLGLQFDGALGGVDGETLAGGGLCLRATRVAICLASTAASTSGMTSQSGVLRSKRNYT